MTLICLHTIASINFFFEFNHWLIAFSENSNAYFREWQVRKLYLRSRILPPLSTGLHVSASSLWFALSKPAWKQNQIRKQTHAHTFTPSIRILCIYISQLQYARFIACALLQPINNSALGALSIEINSNYQFHLSQTLACQVCVFRRACLPKVRVQ